MIRASGIGVGGAIDRYVGRHLLMPFVLLALATGFVGCKREAAPAFGEPTGVQLQVEGTNVQIAIATSGGPGVSSSVPLIASGFDAALKACPDAINVLKTAKGFRTQFFVENGKVVQLDVLPKEPGVACVLKTITGKTLFVTDAGADPSAKFAVLAEFRAAP